jgi:cysteine desulfurase
MKNKIYFDYNSTTPMREEVVRAMMPYLNPKYGLYGNPSSVHTFGQETRAAVEEARKKVADLIGCSTDEIVFTSCGSEADTAAIKGVAFSARERKKGNHILTSSIEHDTVLFCCEYLSQNGFEVTYLPVDKSGLINPEEVRRAIRPETILVTIMHANNEIGTIEPIGAIGKILREKEIPFHTDAVQSVGKIPVNVNDLNVDLLSLSAHKFYGPKGAGALYVRKGTRLHPLFHGHHEKNRRAGTENVAGIVGMGVASEIAQKEMAADAKKVGELRDKLEHGILALVPNAFVNGAAAPRIPGTTNFSFEYVEGEGCVVMMDVEGLAVSTGSACASGTTQASHVLRAIGVPPNVAQGAVRFSLGHFSTEAEVDLAIKTVPKIIERLRSLSPLWSDMIAGRKTWITPAERFIKKPAQQ